MTNASDSDKVILDVQEYNTARIITRQIFFIMFDFKVNKSKHIKFNSKYTSKDTTNKWLFKSRNSCLFVKWQHMINTPRRSFRI